MQDKQSQEEIFFFDSLCTIEQAEELKVKLLEYLEANKRICCDCSRIKKADLSFIQTLYAFKRECKKRSKEFHLTGFVPSSVREAFSLGGFCNAAPENGEELEHFLYDF